MSLLIGAALTAAAFAVLTRVGIVDGALWSVAVVSLAALGFRWPVTRQMIRELVAEYSLALKDSRLLRIIGIPVGALLWVYAIAPPRDGDVMRYHLAHIRQIISDGRWESIADYHYALPFAWTLNYLPFERLALPQAAALVNVGLWLLLLGGLLRVARGVKSSANNGAYASLICVAFLVHPFVIRTFASAMADGYAVFVVHAIALLLLGATYRYSPAGTAPVEHTAPDTRASRDDVLLGFVCWIGAQSRYQLVAAAIAATAVFVLIAVRGRRLRAFLYFAAGAAGALLLSAPFYIANLTAFGNPVWPLFVRSVNGTRAYANHIAADYTAALTGPRDGAMILFRVAELLVSPELFPLAILLVGVVVMSLRARERASRELALFGTLFLCLWVAMQPRLYPRNVLMLLALGSLLLVPALARWSVGDKRGGLLYNLLGAGIVLFVGVSAASSLDYLRYDLTGNSAEFHRFTWYYPVFDWANRHTSRTARFLVITYSGHSYYLDRPYRRADPWLSGVVDWPRIDTAQKLKAVLDRGGYDYVVYDDRDWSEFDGGKAMASSVKSAIARGILKPVHESQERLYTSRITRVFSVSNVYVLKVARDSVAPLQPRASLSAPLSAL